jgi:CHAD domain-containing protein
MPYRLENGEAVRDGLRRCAREQLDDAVKELTDGVDGDPVEAIHEARKALKKERSLLRLARSALDPRERRQEAIVLRQAARSLSQARDADVMIETLDDLSKRFAGAVPSTAVASARKRLVEERDGERAGSMQSGSAAAVAIELRAAGRRVDSWHLRRGGWAAIAGGLLRSYRRGRRAFDLARAEPTPENLHDWRKRVKDLWYHLRLLRPLSESTMRGQADEAHRLSELLGDDHDIYVLREALTGMANEIPVDVDPLIAAIDHRRGMLQTDAVLLGRRLYAEKPKAFLRRIHGYWKAWRAEASAARSRDGASASVSAAGTSG